MGKKWSHQTLLFSHLLGLTIKIDFKVELRWMNSTLPVIQRKVRLKEKNKYHIWCYFHFYAKFYQVLSERKAHPHFQKSKCLWVFLVAPLLSFWKEISLLWLSFSSAHPLSQLFSLEKGNNIWLLLFICFRETLACPSLNHIY